MARPEKKNPRTNRWNRIRIAVLLALVPGLLGLAFLHWPLTAGLEERYGLDLLFKLRGPVPPPPGVCVVAIDDASYLEYGINPKAPWPRALHGELVQVLAREGAAAVAFDVLFEGAGDIAGDTRFELGLFDAGNVVLGATVERTDDPRFREARRIEPHGPFAESAAAVAEVELPPDNDGVIRRTWLTLEGRPSLALGAYEVATGDRSLRDEHGTRLISYYGPPRTIQTVSLYQALDPEQFLPPDYFRDRIVFVGASQVASVSVSEIKDSFPTPFSGGEVGFTYGVEIHASVTANLLEGRGIRVLPPVFETLLLLGLALLASLTFIYLRPVFGIVALVVLEVSAWLAAYGAFTGAELWIPAVIPGVVQLPTAYVMSLVWYYLTTVRERENIRRAFGFYLSPEMIRRIAESPDSLRLGGEEIVGTAVFTDIAGFTSVAEQMTASETVSMLNDYFSETTRRIWNADQVHRRCGFCDLGRPDRDGRSRHTGLSRGRVDGPCAVPTGRSPGGPSRHTYRSPYGSDAGRQPRIVTALRLHGHRRHHQLGRPSRVLEQGDGHPGPGQRRDDRADGWQPRRTTSRPGARGRPGRTRHALRVAGIEG